jgi:predicted Fe-S protein YdhL (DUF1289 family)
LTDLDRLFESLSKSSFRRSFHLRGKERAYIADKSMPVVMQHAQDFILRRLAPASPSNDGKQTPFKGHPVFVAQHATATCCRGCLAKWHDIKAGHDLTDEEQRHVARVIERWLTQEMEAS